MGLGIEYKFLHRSGILAGLNYAINRRDPKALFGTDVSQMAAFLGYSVLASDIRVWGGLNYTMWFMEQEGTPGRDDDNTHGFPATGNLGLSGGLILSINDGRAFLGLEGHYSKVEAERKSLGAGNIADLNMTTMRVEIGIALGGKAK